MYQNIEYTNAEEDHLTINFQNTVFDNLQWLTTNQFNELYDFYQNTCMKEIYYDDKDLKQLTKKAEDLQKRIGIQ